MKFSFSIFEKEDANRLILEAKDRDSKNSDVKMFRAEFNEKFLAFLKSEFRFHIEELVDLKNIFELALVKKNDPNYQIQKGWCLDPSPRPI